MSVFRLAMASLLLVLLAVPCGAARKPFKPYRSQAGIGLLLVSSATSGNKSLTFYLEPGVGKISDAFPGSLPKLDEVAPGREGDSVFAVMGKRGGWYRLAYDEAGREGWVRGERSWSFVPWQDYLRGRSIRLLPGLKKGMYYLNDDVDGTPRLLRTVTAGQPMKCRAVQDDSVQVVDEAGTVGWLKWRDEDGRLLITIDPE